MRSEDLDARGASEVTKCGGYVRIELRVVASHNVTFEWHGKAQLLVAFTIVRFVQVLISFYCMTCSLTGHIATSIIVFKRK